jgi:uncharacterized protein YukJ
MGHINYQCLRGRVHAVAPAAPPTNPHLWVILDVNGEQWFATINVRSDKDALGEPAGKSYLYYLVDADFDHPFVPSILARPEGLSAVERSFAGGALDFQRAGLFDPAAMRILPPEGPGHDGLVQRLTAILALAKNQDCDVFFYGNAFMKDNPRQTDAAFGYTPQTPFGLDNVHMAQGDPQSINARLRENGVWHDGACFVWDGRASRMTAVFLSFQSQAWHTNDSGDPMDGATGAEAPAYDFSKADGGLIMPPPPRLAQLTSVHRRPDGAASVVLTNMSHDALDLSGWALVIDARAPVDLPSAKLGPGLPLSVALAPGSLEDRGGVLMLVNPSGLSVHCVAHCGGDPVAGWSSSLG